LREMILEIFSQLIEPIRSRVYNIVSRGVIELAKDTEGMQVLKAAILADENRDDIEYFQDYGFTSVPLAGAEALIVCPQGNRDHMIAVKVADRRFRLKGLTAGEVALYTDEGDKIVFKRGNKIEVVAATKVTLTTPLAEFSADVIIKGNLDVDGNETVKGDEIVKGTSAVTGAITSLASVTAPAVTGSATVSGPSIVAATSLTVAGEELNDYKNHTHDYQDDDGTSETTKQTAGVN